MTKHHLDSDPAEFLSEAYNLEDPGAMKAFYEKWADQYDQQMIDGLKYLSPFIIAEKLIEYVHDTQAKILDIGCGTGLTVKKLVDAGYRNLYGIDLSEDMVNVATSRGYYQSLQAGDVNLPLTYADNEFQGVISSGTFTHGHVGPEPFDEIARILQSGGVFACTIHNDLWESHGFAQKLADLESKHVFEELYLERDRYFEGEPKDGWFCVYRKV